MIKEIKKGDYTLTQTKFETRILTLDDTKSYAWIVAEGIGEILVLTDDEHTLSATLSTGEYVLYDVEDEPELTDLVHLELQTGAHSWQGYLLTNGLPTEKAKRHRIIPTDQLIH
jgi:hypothetical protein